MLFRDTEEAAQFIATADSRETSPEIMQAIVFFARDAAEAVSLWEGDALGTACNLVDIWEHVTGNGQRDARDYCWGASGHRWWDLVQDAKPRHHLTRYPTILLAVAALSTLVGCVAPSQAYLDAATRDCAAGDHAACQAVPALQSQVTSEHQQQAAQVVGGVLLGIAAVAAGVAVSRPAPYYQPVYVCRWRC